MIRAYYYASISFVDHQVGRILESLESAGRLEDTLVIFSSDHGELLGDYRCFGKRSFHDAASRVPLIMRGRGVTAAERCGAPVSSLDIPATILAAANARFESHSPDGVDLRATASHEPTDRCVFSQLHRAGDGLYMAVNREWKYVYSAPDQRELLFDRVKDPSETQDLAHATWDPAWPTSRALRQMRGILVDWLQQQGEDAALDGGKLRVYPRREMPPNNNAWLLYQDHPWAGPA